MRVGVSNAGWGQDPNPLYGTVAVPINRIIDLNPDKITTHSSTVSSYLPSSHFPLPFVFDKKVIAKSGDMITNIHNDESISGV